MPYFVWYLRRNLRLRLRLRLNLTFSQCCSATTRCPRRRVCAFALIAIIHVTSHNINTILLRNMPRPYHALDHLTRGKGGMGKERKGGAVVGAEIIS